MKPLIAVALVVVGLGVPAYAQRGGGAHGGGSIGHGGGSGFASHRGGFAGAGFASHAAPAAQGSFASVGRAGFVGAPRVSGPYRYASPGLRTIGPGPTGVTNRRPGYGGDRNRGLTGVGYRRPYVPYHGYGVGLPYSVGWIPDNLDYPNDFYNGDSSYAAPATDDVNGPAAGYEGQPMEQSEAAPAPVYAYRPAYATPAPAAAQEPALEEPVTLIFKDGRPTEQIHNYMLTRTTLYVQGQHLREIPVAALDLAAMAKVNGDAGVDFQLPQ